jgi:hypothetical protein
MWIQVLDEKTSPSDGHSRHFTVCIVSSDELKNWLDTLPIAKDDVISLRGFNTIQIEHHPRHRAAIIFQGYENIQPPQRRKAYKELQEGVRQMRDLQFIEIHTTNSQHVCYLMQPVETYI